MQNALTYKPFAGLSMVGSQIENKVEPKPKKRKLNKPPRMPFVLQALMPNRLTGDYESGKWITIYNKGECVTAKAPAKKRDEILARVLSNKDFVEGFKIQIFGREDAPYVTFKDIRNLKVRWRRIDNAVLDRSPFFNEDAVANNPIP